MSNRINKIKISLLITALITMLGLVACGSNEETVAAAAPIATANAAPTATLEAIEPAVNAEPEPTPFSELTDEQFAQMSAEVLAQPVVEFPAAISKGSEPLSDEEVLAEWTEYLVGGVFTLFEDTLFWGFCDGGLGTWIVESGSPHLTGAKFDWVIRNDPGASWNSIVVDITMQDRELYPGQHTTGIYRSQALTPPGYSGYGKPVYLSTDCS